MKRNLIEGKPVVYLDETWANAHDEKDKAWVEKHTTCKKGTIGGVQYVEILYLFLIKFFSQKTIWKRRMAYSVACWWKRWMGCW